MLVGTDVCVQIVFVWEETGVPGVMLLLFVVILHSLSLPQPMYTVLY